MSGPSEHDETPRPGHPVEAFLCSVLDDLKGLADVPVWSMDAATTERVVRLAAKVAAGVAEVEARVVGHADTLDLPAAGQCRSVARWLQQTTKVTRRTASSKAKLAKALADTGAETTRTALARGEVHAEQAVVITGHLADLDDEKVSSHDQARAEAFLLDHATGHDADDLVRLGREIWQRLDPDGAEAREARALEAQEERARKKTRLRMADDGEGMTHGTFSIPTAQASMFRKHLHAFAAPKHKRATEGAGSYDWQTPTPQKMGQAFCEWIEAYHTDQLPQIGGVAATVVVIGDYELLAGKVKAAQLDTGVRISHTEFLRMACEAGIIPMWMNANSEVLASGRRHRFHTPTQRLAATVERKHCRHDGCDVPAYLCHLHHQTPWAQGGTTDLRTAQVLCPPPPLRPHRDEQAHPTHADLTAVVAPAARGLGVSRLVPLTGALSVSR